MFLEIDDILTADEVAELRALAAKATFVDGRISSPHSTHSSVPSPCGRRARAPWTPSVMVSWIWSRTAPSCAQPFANVFSS